MGLLDDAIREHLELKRRRGADPAEVEKQEREALGPVGAAAAEDRAAPVADAPAAAAVYDDEPPAADYDDSTVPLDEERAALRDPARYDDDPDPFADAHEGLDEDRTPAPPREPAGAVRAPEPPAREEPPPVSQPTEQYSVDDLEELRREDEPEDGASEPPAEGEDVLDETPDFLQEAPEHDRLWFEQRPPRDFDF